MLQNSNPQANRAVAVQRKTGAAPKRDINLLPANTQTEKMARRGYVALALTVGALIAGYFAIGLPLMRLSALQNDAAAAESQLAEKKVGEADFTILTDKRNALMEIKNSLELADGAMLQPADLLESISGACPGRITLLSATISAGGLALSGRAENNGDIAQFLVNLQTLPGVSFVLLDSARQDEESGLRVFELKAGLAGAVPEAPKGGDGQ